MRTICDESELREYVQAPSAAIAEKAIDHIDEVSARFIAASPLFMLATSGADGSCDVSPRGDPAGSVLVLDSRTLAFGDRKGNRRLDSMRNILGNSAVGMLFIVPGVGDTLRLNGTARVVADAPYLPRLTVSGVTPDLAIEVIVEELFLHCTKAFARSALWDPATWPAADGVPSAGEIVRGQHGTPVPAHVIDEALRHDARVNRY
ncbi:MSMEG_1061 family FMN-dependent PPOX-type flavoprotein [Pseudonocardia alaniniphila]|uniref:Pyridoxamine 5'-phosphate oxidase family protein n=1 Tax=Pseudonocardia alaniniphila TaxID=75291 RepID=A0ABS9T956_9PSEU|nr:MSMEG_1061 family FMN-dependent PPOX-type flavoprotein [Pseudonocardia alaniniphila]MCH6165067.1 pyridoxamine 5'-phosphate oxidase family protein [Pseudonocardia alaniniphila]